MQATITLPEKEVRFLRALIEHHRNIETKHCTIEDAVHECIRTAMSDEGEQRAQAAGIREC
ncbi:MAG: hypothetical protein P8013_01075 [Candidatus Sulfobium sp.]|jgi:hypothetical protein